MVSTHSLPDHVDRYRTAWLMRSDGGRRAPTEPSKISFKRVTLIGLDDLDAIVDAVINEGKKRESGGTREDSKL
jgi:hypothetical protein